MVRSTSTPSKRRHLLVLLAGALRAAEPRLRHQIPERQQQHRGDAPDDELLVGQRHRKIVLVEQHELALHHRRDRLVARALRHLHEIRQEDRHADRRDQRRQPERAAQRPVGDALDHPVDQRGEQHRHDQHDEQRQRDRGDAEPGGEDQEGDQRDEGRDHEHVAMGEVHHADDAEHHRIADGDQAVDRTERDAVDELLDEVFHASAALSESR